MNIPHTNHALLTAMLATVAVLTACSTVDCPLNNTVYANYKLMGKVTKLPDALTISTTRQDGVDSVLINQQTNTDSFFLPMSYSRPTDTLYFQTNTLKDTVWVSKDNHPHFESVDCGLSFFHTITAVAHTRHAIDSIVINQREVTYDASKQHLHIYFKEYRY